MTRDVIDLSLARTRARRDDREPMRALTILLFVVAACSGDTPAQVDAPSGPMCTGLAYDACNATASNCMNGAQCHFYQASNFTVCSPTCSASVPCPNQGSTPVACNNMGLCKPAAPNTDCH